MKELVIEAETEHLEQVLAFVEELLEGTDCPMKSRMQIDIAVEEIFVNIAHYAYAPEAGSATIRGELGDGPSVTLTFMDRGMPYNPLAREDPDVTLAVEDRQIGGLGVYMVKKTMDEVSYEYLGGQNILTIRKAWGGPERNGEVHE